MYRQILRMQCVLIGFSNCRCSGRGNTYTCHGDNSSFGNQCVCPNNMFAPARGARARKGSFRLGNKVCEFVLKIGKQYNADSQCIVS